MSYMKNKEIDEMNRVKKKSFFLVRGDGVIRIMNETRRENPKFNLEFRTPDGDGIELFESLGSATAIRITVMKRRGD